jgi:hypothetical protein
MDLRIKELEAELIMTPLKRVEKFVNNNLRKNPSDILHEIENNPLIKTMFQMAGLEASETNVDGKKMVQIMSLKDKTSVTFGNGMMFTVMPYCISQSNDDLPREFNFSSGTGFQVIEKIKSKPVYTSPIDFTKIFDRMIKHIFGGYVYPSIFNPLQTPEFTDIERYEIAKKYVDINPNNVSLKECIINNKNLPFLLLHERLYGTPGTILSLQKEIYRKNMSGDYSDLERWGPTRKEPVSEYRRQLGYVHANHGYECVNKSDLGYNGECGNCEYCNATNDLHRDYKYHY